mmetsp:Transcript_3309/g.8173  ORF Transcript_3309/g.8173 Transcript_3309/m.8173 type:complete len:464 (+) Transcript_3309:198-1589(+)
MEVLPRTTELRKYTAVTILLAALLVLFSTRCDGLAKQPLQGQGTPPDEKVEVYVSAFLERLLEINDKEYRFENIIRLYFTWRDDRAKQAFEDSTTAYRNGSLETCQKPCTDSVELSRDQTGFNPEFSCCDGVWLPSITTLNVYQLPSGRLQPYGIFINTRDTDDGVEVVWWVSVHAVYFTPMYFRDFPFDTQKLVMQFNEPSGGVSGFVPSATSTRWLVRGEGDIVSGWEVERVTIYPNFTSVQSTVDYVIDNYGTPPAAGDPVPITGKAFRDDSFISRQVFVTFDVELVVKRLNSYYVMNTFAKLIILVFLSFVSYVIPAENFASRLSMNMTLFLTLTALNFTLNQQLPASSYPTVVNKLVLVCYVVCALAVPETILVHAVTTRAAPAEGQDKTDTTSPIFLSSLLRQFTRAPWRSTSKLWATLQRREHATRVAFAIDMFFLVLMVLVVIISSSAILTGAIS